MSWMLKNSKEQKDSMLTFAVIGLLITSLSVLVSFFDTLSVGSFSVKFKQVDNVLVLGFLGATLTAYVNRRNTKDKLDQTEERKVRGNF